MEEAFPMTERMGPLEGSEPEGPGFGKAWVSAPKAYLAEGFYVRTIIDVSSQVEPQALIALDLTGRWNKGSRENHSLIIHPEVAEELGRYLLEAASVAPRDLEQFLESDPGAGKSEESGPRSSGD
jgi:hypothetical protein